MKTYPIVNNSEQLYLYTEEYIVIMSTERHHRAVYTPIEYRCIIVYGRYVDQMN
mgnify:FL=1